MALVIKKSSRHSKIIGDFSEHLVLYWLSKHGFECARVDHVGIDLIARNPHTDELMAISVKSRSRYPKTETASIGIYDADIKKAKAAGNSFKCDSVYFAIVMDVKDRILVFVVPVQKIKDTCAHYGNFYDWKMSDRYLQQYYADPDIKWFDFATHTGSWWGLDNNN